MADFDITKYSPQDILDFVKSQTSQGRNRAGQIVKNPNETVPGALVGLANMLQDAARGTLTGVAGAPGDISEAIRSFKTKHRNRAGQYVNPDDILGERYFPTSEELQNKLGYEQSVPLKLGQHIVAPMIGPGEIVKGIKATKDMPLGLSMIGPESKVWKKTMAEAAAKMEKEGVEAEKIHQTTGMVRGLDNKWRQEISDLWSSLKDKKVGGSSTFGEIHSAAADKLGGRTATVKLNDILSHDDLLKAYPKLGEIEVRRHLADTNTKGFYQEKGNQISLREDLTPEEAKSTILHELTHAIQAKEGWNRGANYNDIFRKYHNQELEIEERLRQANEHLSKAVGTENYGWLMDQRNKISKEYMDFIGANGMGKHEKAYDEYAHSAGEAEARLVQRRMNLGEAGREEHFPYEHTGESGYGLDIHPDKAVITTRTPATINQPSQSIDLTKIPTKEEYEAMVNKGQMRQARTFNQDLEDTLAGKVSGNKFEIPTHSNHAFDYEMGDFTKKLEDAGLHVYDNKYGTVYAGKTAKDLELIKNAETPLEHGLSFGYTPEDIAKFYTNRRGGNPEMGYAEYLDDLKHVQNKYAPSFESVNYRGHHKAPGKDDFHAPAHELDRLYPEDVYGELGHHYYGSGGSSSKMDREVVNLLREARGNPDHEITIYRAVPSEYKDADINKGDWVTPTLEYAHNHGLREFDSHHILEKRVPARHLFTNADSLQEFGYDPFD
jgi:hypothetical protein